MSLTVEETKRIELNRIKAKATQRQKEQEISSSSALNSNGKRPIGVTPVNSASPTAPSKNFQRNSRLGAYYEYDLSKMVNTKGGFLAEEGKEVDEGLRRKEQQREKQRALKNLEPPVYLETDRNPQCNECQTIDIDHTFKKVFGCLVCHKCQKTFPEKYSLLTKTECKEDYLLTDPELRDQELLPHLLKANPHASTFANMMLFLRFQVEAFAWKKWGSPEDLDAEFEKRTEEKRKKKNKKFEKGLLDLRKRTREGAWQKKKDKEHKHVYGVLKTGQDGVAQQVCHECGFTVDVEVL